MPLRACFLLCLMAIGAPGTAAQEVVGTVFEEGSSRLLPGVEIQLFDSTGEQIARTLSNAYGRFGLTVERPGPYVLTAQSFGYRRHRMDEVEIPDAGVVTVTVSLRSEPIALDGITGTVHRRREFHEMSYAGFYARHRESHSVGSNRVILRTDPEFDVVATVRDLLYNFRPSAVECGPFLFWNGFYIGRAMRDSIRVNDYLDTAASMVEGIEYYRDLTSIPLSIRGEPGITGEKLSTIRRCGVLVIWPRRS